MFAIKIVSEILLAATLVLSMMEAMVSECSFVFCIALRNVSFTVCV